MSHHPIVLLTPSLAAAQELPRRLASSGGAVAGLYPMKILELARAVAEPVLLGRGLRAWDNGHDALLAARLLADGFAGFTLPTGLPRARVAATLARTLQSLRRGGVSPDRLATYAERPAHTGGDRERLRSLAAIYRRFHEALEGRTADPGTLLGAAVEGFGDSRWLAEAEVIVLDDLELDPIERDFVAALARVRPVRILRRDLPPGLRRGSFRAWAGENGVAETEARGTVLAPVAAPAPPEGLARLRQGLFEPPSGPAIDDGSVVLVSAPGEAAEVRALARRMLEEARRGVPFEEMGVILPRPGTYARLFTDLFDRLGVPSRLHPSLPLNAGRSARSLLLLFRCRGLVRSAVMEFLTFAPVPFEKFLGEAEAEPARWDAISRDAGIVSGFDRWMIGLRAFAEAEREGAPGESSARRVARERVAGQAEALLEVVEKLSGVLELLSGSEPWSVWSERLRSVCEDWIRPEPGYERVLEVVADLGGLSTVASEASWEDVEHVLEDRFEQERLPLAPAEGGAVHVGALDAMAGLSFRVVAVPGLVEGGYPGVLRPDPFLLDGERDTLDAQGDSSPPEPTAPRTPSAEGSDAGRTPRPGDDGVGKPPSKGQLNLFDDGPLDSAPVETPGPVGLPSSVLPRLATTQDRLLEARRLFHRAVSQATERLVLSYPRADARSGRERLPSLFFAAAAATLAGRPLAAADLEQLVTEDDPSTLSLEATLDAGERDRARVREGGRAAAEAIAAGSSFFKQSRLAAQARWSGRLTRYDGLLSDLPGEVLEKVDPLKRSRAMSASRLAVYSRCGFQYLLEHVLHLEAALEPEERRRLDPLERGTLFHDVAERFLRERRDRDELPVEDGEANRVRILEMAEEGLEKLVEGSPPRFTLLWEREKRRFRESVLSWLQREAAMAGRSTPAHFEVSFGLGEGPDGKEPHDPDPIEIPLGDGRLLRVSGKIDRIDRRDDGLVLRDYKTGRAPKDDGRVFRGGRQLQIPFYILATKRLFDGAPVVEAFLDYVDGGRQVAFDPAAAEGETFRTVLSRLVDLIASGVFVQEPAACDWCDFKVVCGPKGLLQRRRQIKIQDKTLQSYLRLRDLG